MMVWSQPSLRIRLGLRLRIAPSTPSQSKTDPREVTMTGMYEKVLDWVNDFDHADPEYNERAHEIWAEFQGSECPVAHSERYDGLWAPFTYEMVHEIAYDTEH